MEAEQTSRTAEYMAFFRALESSHRSGERLIADPFAVSFLRPTLHRAVRLAKNSWFRFLIERYADRRMPGARTSAVARTRLIDETCAGAIHDGVRQIVILGAGFDCRAYRMPETGCATVFELDHPATQRLKIARLHRALPAIPENVHLAEIDFKRQSLQEVLTASGFDGARPALFLWEGVTNYLTEESVKTVLRFVGACSPGTRIVFTYVHRGVLDGSTAFYGGERIRRDVAELGEPWTFGLDPGDLPAFLSECNLKLDSDEGAAEYRARFYESPAARMKGYDFYHVAIAHVTG